jgi:hypothetical protein
LQFDSDTSQGILQRKKRKHNRWQWAMQQMSEDVSVEYWNMSHVWVIEDKIKTVDEVTYPPIRRFIFTLMLRIHNDCINHR